MNLFKEFGSGFNNFVDGVGDFFGGIGNTIKGAWDSITSKGVSGIWDDYTGNTANRENIEYQKEYNQDVWNRADTQYQRTVADLRAAGLSSQLAAGAPSTVAGQSAAPQRTVGNESQAMERLIGMITSMKQTEASVNLTNAQADKARAETSMVNKELGTYGERTAVDIALKRSESDYNVALTNIAMIEGQYKASEIESRIGNTLADTKYKNSLISLAEKQSSLYEAQTLESSAKTALYGAQKSESEARTENLQSSTALNNATKEKVRAEQLKLEKEKEKIANEVDLVVKQGLHLDAQTELLLKQATLAELNYTIDLYNFDTSYRNGLRTTDDMPKSLLGLSGLAYQFGNYLNNAIQNFK